MAKKIAYYREKADKAMQIYMRTKTDVCEICGNELSCHHHFHTKSASSALRYDEENLIAVCKGCHQGFHSNRSSEMDSRAILLRGTDWAEKLIKKKSNYVKPSIGYYKEIREKYERLSNNR